MKTIIFIFSVLIIAFIFQSCTKDSSTIRELVTGETEASIEVYNNKPINDPNDLDRINARNILPEEKLYGKYQYKISKIGFFAAEQYLLKHKKDGDAVISYTGTDGKRVVRIYTNNPILDKEFL